MTAEVPILLGDKIHDLRVRRGLTVQQLASATGLSKGFISQIENHRTSPSLATLQGFARALETSAAYLVVEEDQVPCVVRSADRPQLATCRVASRVEVLSARPKRNLELVMIELPPGRLAGDERHSHHGEACLLCEEGDVRLICGEHIIDLAPGDSCHYDGRLPHALENAGRGIARVLLAITPAAYEQGFESNNGDSKPSLRAPRAVDSLS